MELDILGNWLVILAMIPAVASVIVYSQVKWWKSPAGIHLMTYMAAIASVLILATLRFVIPDTEVFWGIRVVAYVAVVIALWWRLGFLITSYMEIKEEE